MVEAPRALDEAWSNYVFSVRTESGRYAVKLFRHDPGAGLRSAMPVEAIALGTGSVPMAKPVATSDTGSWLAELETDEGRWWARCHEWVDGTPSSTLEPTVEKVRDVGRSVGILHALHLDGGDTAQLPSVDRARWQRNVSAATAAGVAWAAELAALTPLVDDLATRLSRLRGERRPMRLSHRDLDPKNAVVRPDGRVAITDWDYAGPVVPGVELVVAAMSFSGGRNADRGLVEEFVAAYRSSGGDAPPPDTLAMTTEAAIESLSWLLLNVERCLDPATGDDFEGRHGLTYELIASFGANVDALVAIAHRVAQLL